MDFRGRTPKEIAEDPTASSLEMDLAKALIAVDLQNEAMRKVLVEVHKYVGNGKGWDFDAALIDGMISDVLRPTEKPKDEPPTISLRGGGMPLSIEKRECSCQDSEPFPCPIHG